ncbi:unnamed protein product [Amoebophrya sp. A25]|nr:unnamed protein product [Amoebophrya sp. A25]|eukprot:GSA25T00025028001.1
MRVSTKLKTALQRALRDCLFSSPKGEDASIGLSGRLGLLQPWNSKSAETSCRRSLWSSCPSSSPSCSSSRYFSTSEAARAPPVHDGDQREHQDRARPNICVSTRTPAHINKHPWDSIEEGLRNAIEETRRNESVLTLALAERHTDSCTSCTSTIGILLAAKPEVRRWLIKVGDDQKTPTESAFTKLIFSCDRLGLHRGLLLALSWRCRERLQRYFEGVSEKSHSASTSASALNDDEAALKTSSSDVKRKQLLEEAISDATRALMLDIRARAGDFDLLRVRALAFELLDYKEESKRDLALWRQLRRIATVEKKRYGDRRGTSEQSHKEKRTVEVVTASSAISDKESSTNTACLLNSWTRHDYAQVPEKRMITQKLREMSARRRIREQAALG